MRASTARSARRSAAAAPPRAPHARQVCTCMHACLPPSLPSCLPDWRHACLPACLLACLLSLRVCVRACASDRTGENSKLSHSCSAVNQRTSFFFFLLPCVHRAGLLRAARVGGVVLLLRCCFALRCFVLRCAAALLTLRQVVLWLRAAARRATRVPRAPRSTLPARRAARSGNQACLLQYLLSASPPACRAAPCPALPDVFFITRKYPFFFFFITILLNQTKLARPVASLLAPRAPSLPCPASSVPVSNTRL